MPFLALGALAGGAIGAGVAGTAAATAVGGIAGGALLGAGVGSALQGSSDAKKAQQQASQAAQAGQINIAAIDAQTREMARRNALESAELERQLTPEVPQLRTAANQAVLQGLQPSGQQQAAIDSLYARMGGSVSTPLLQAAIDKARADLAQGGQLSVDQRNEAARRGLSTSGAVTGGLGLGRDLAARDIGLTSYQVEQQRLQNAAGLGSQELGREQFNATNFLNQFQALQNYYNNNRSFALGAAQYGQSIQQPIVGLDPSSAANLAVGNSNNAQAAATNAANIKGQQAQGLTQLGGQFLGFGLSRI